LQMGLYGPVVGQSSGTLPTRVQTLVSHLFSGFFPKKKKQGTRARSVVLRVSRALDAREPTCVCVCVCGKRAPEVESLTISSLRVYGRARVCVCVIDFQYLLCVCTDAHVFVCGGNAHSRLEYLPISSLCVYGHTRVCTCGVSVECVGCVHLSSTQSKRKSITLLNAR
jgi:hypothetical protein